MSSEVLINSNQREIRVALMENHQVAELFIEHEANKGIVGNIYRGKVTKILPGMQVAFVDIGLHDSGLVHVSQLSNTFVKDPHEIVGIGDQVKVWVTSIDKDRHRVALTMIEPGTETPPEAKSKRGQKRPSKRPPKRGTPPPYKRKLDNAKQKHSAHHARKPSRPHKPKKPVVPITESMKEGKEPMKTFGDLAQFFTKAEKPKSEEEKKKG